MGTPVKKGPCQSYCRACVQPPACATPRPRRHCCCYFIVDASEARRPLGEQDSLLHASQPSAVQSIPPVLPSSIRPAWPSEHYLGLPRRAAPRPRLSHNFFRLLSLPGPCACALCLLARTPALSQAAANRLSPPSCLVTPRATTTTTATLLRAQLPPAPWAVHCRAVCLPLATFTGNFFCFCDVGRHAPYLVIGNRLPAPGLDLSLRPSFLLRCKKACLPTLSTLLFSLDHPAAPSPQNPRGRKEGRNPGRKEGITRPRPRLWLRGHQGPFPAAIDLDRVPSQDPKPDFSS